MMAALEFWVPGIARTKGSVDTGAHGQVLHTQASKDRAGAIVRYAEAAIARYGWQTVYSAVSVMHYAWLPDDGGHDDGAAIWCMSGDLDKIDRNLLDALTRAGVWADDVLVVEIVSRKHRASRDVPPGEYVLVRTVHNAPALRMRDEGASRRAREAAGVGMVA